MMLLQFCNWMSIIQALILRTRKGPPQAQKTRKRDLFVIKSLNSTCLTCPIGVWPTTLHREGVQVWPTSLSTF